MPGITTPMSRDTFESVQLVDWDYHVK